MSNLVWHGSEHVFEQFSVDAIGTGEGSQMFGWGLYFASCREVAEHYYEKLTNPGETLGWYVEQDEDGNWIVYDADDAVLNAFESEEEANLMVEPKGTGQVCLVEIPDDDQYLLWDKPLSEQPLCVLNAVDQLLGPTVSYETLKYFQGAADADYTGKDFYTNLKQSFFYLSPPHDAQAASLALRDFGIAGIKYLDGMSRDAQAGSHNYVVFDCALVSIKSVFNRLETVVEESSLTSPSVRAPWGDFPAVIRNGDLGSLKVHPDYLAAKSGDVLAAHAVVMDTLQSTFVESAVELVGETPPSAVTILPVLAEEAAGRNKIPLAVAFCLADRLGCEVELQVVQSNLVRRTDQGADYRLANSPTFVGHIISGRAYLLVDDTLTMGGTLAALRGHVLAQGGVVLGAVVMTAHPDALSLKIKPSMIQSIVSRHGDEMHRLCREVFGYELECLTQGEAGHFRKAASADMLRDRLAAAGHERLFPDIESVASRCGNPVIETDCMKFSASASEGASADDVRSEIISL